jgi:hypothetical protein
MKKVPAEFRLPGSSASTVIARPSSLEVAAIRTATLFIPRSLGRSQIHDWRR